MVDKVPEGYKKTEVGVIPEDWEVCEIQAAYDICNNLRLPISEFVRKGMQGKYPYYGPTKIQDYINEYRLDGEYALIGEDGDHFLKWSTMPMTLLATGKFNVNNHVHVVKGINNETKWFYWYFNQKDITPVLSRQGAGRYKLNKATLKTIKMPIPPLPEQAAIAEVLSDMGSLISLIEMLIAKKQRIKQGAMQELLTGQKRLSEFSGKWGDITLGSLGKCIRGVSYNGDNDLYLLETQASIILLRSNNIQNNTLNLLDVLNVDKEKVKKEQILIKDDIVICMANGSKDLVGKAAVYKNDNATSHTFGAFMASFRVNNTFNSKYVAYLFYTNDYRLFISNTLSGSSINNLTPKSIESFIISLPSTIEEQTAIAQILSDIDEEIDKLTVKLNKYKAIKQGMMQELLTGKRRLV